MSREGLFNVYIERARSAAPDAAAKLAQAIAAHYGIDAAAIQQRLGVGRFRVKSNVDRATADSFASDLARLGAIVKVERAEEATPPPPAVAPAAASATSASPAGKPAKRNRTPPTGVKIPAIKSSSPISLQQPRVAVPAVPAVKAVGTPRPTPVPIVKPAASEPAQRPSKPQFASGLAAAAAAKPSDDLGLGALSGDIPLTLATLDGEDDSELSASRSIGLPASFGPPPEPPPPALGSSPATSTPDASDDDFDVAIDDDDSGGAGGEVDMAAALPASMGPAMAARELGGGPAPARDLGGTHDMFAPPDADEEIALALDVEPVRKKSASEPAAVMAAPPSADAAAPSSAPAPGQVMAPAVASAPSAPGEAAWKRYGRDERVRFVAGVLVAAAIGCVPALVTASVRKRSAFADLDSQLEVKQAQVLTRADWDNLDRVRASFVERKKSEQQSIAVTSLLLWAAVSGGVAFVWFRKIDWDRIFER